MARSTKFDFGDRPWLLLCEGMSDKEFLHRLQEAHNLCPGKFTIRHPGRESEGGGNGKFGRYLDNALVRPEFREIVSAVLIISDSDDDPHRSFTEIKRALELISFPAPERERTVARKKNYPDVVVMMIPKDSPGSLETLCVEAAYAKWGLKAPLDGYLRATPAAHWGPVKQDKMRLNAMFAATCATKPETTLAYVWQEDEAYHLPLDHAAFSDLVNFLRGFEALIST